MLRHHRKSHRLPGRDYARPGHYYITVCTRNRERLFCVIRDGRPWLNEFGTIVRDEWFRTARVRPEIDLDVFVVMPDHIHGVIVIRDTGRTTVGADGRPPLPRLYRTPRSLGSIIAGYKSIVTARINQTRKTPGQPVWQRDYYERVIRDGDDLERIRRYIEENPSRWREG